jgi:hypothetical protein
MSALCQQQTNGTAAKIQRALAVRTGLLSESGAAPVMSRRCFPDYDLVVANGFASTHAPAVQAVSSLKAVLCLGNHTWPLSM